METETENKPPHKVGRTLVIALAVLLILAAVGAAGYGLATHPRFTAVLRDILIIVLALMTIVIGLFLGILILQLQSLIALLRDEVRPILESANQTVSTVRGTTSFVSHTLVTPVVTAASYASAVRQMFKVLVGRAGKEGRQQAISQEAGEE